MGRKRELEEWRIEGGDWRLETGDCLVTNGLDESCLTNWSVAESEEDVNLVKVYNQTHDNNNPFRSNPRKHKSTNRL